MTYLPQETPAQMPEKPSGQKSQNQQATHDLAGDGRGDNRGGDRDDSRGDGGDGRGRVGFWAIFSVFLRLGLTSFGGPVAHIAYFRTEFVDRRRQITDAAFSDLLALCQFVPGPASSQLGMGIGFVLGGWRGVAAAWLGFTLPSAVILLVLGLMVQGIDAGRGMMADAVHGLKLVAVAVVAHALLGMARSLCPDMPRLVIAVLAGLVVMFSAILPAGMPGVFAAGIIAAPIAGVIGQIGAILLGLLAGIWILGGRIGNAPVGGAQADAAGIQGNGTAQDGWDAPDGQSGPGAQGAQSGPGASDAVAKQRMAVQPAVSGNVAKSQSASGRGYAPVMRLATGIGPGAGLAMLLVFGGLLVIGIFGARIAPHGMMAVFDGFYRSGALVFGGGHVVLPLLQDAVVTPGWVGSDRFLAGYGATQAVPGPIFAFAAYLGAAMVPVGGIGSGAGMAGMAAAIGMGIFALISVFLPGFLLLAGVLPFWDRVRHIPAMRAGLAGINAAVVGLLAAVLYDPLLTTAIGGAIDMAIVALAFAVLQWRVLPVWLLVLAGAGMGMLAGLSGI